MTSDRSLTPSHQSPTTRHYSPITYLSLPTNHQPLFTRHGFFGDQAYKDILQAHVDRSELQESPAAGTDDPCELLAQAPVLVRLDEIPAQRPGPGLHRDLQDAWRL